MRAWSKRLVLFAALLSPFQALQGTHVLCLFTGDHGSALSDGDKMSACGERYQCYRDTSLSRSGEDWHRIQGDLSDFHSQENRQRDCPPDCLCQRPTQPQLQPPSLAELKGVDHFLVPTVIETYAKGMIFSRDCTDSRCDPPAIVSPQQCCIVLCRFTI